MLGLSAVTGVPAHSYFAEMLVQKVASTFLQVFAVNLTWGRNAPKSYT